MMAVIVTIKSLRENVNSLKKFTIYLALKVIGQTQNLLTMTTDAY